MTIAGLDAILSELTVYLLSTDDAMIRLTCMVVKIPPRMRLRYPSCHLNHPSLNRVDSVSHHVVMRNESGTRFSVELCHSATPGYWEAVYSSFSHGHRSCGSWVQPMQIRAHAGTSLPHMLLNAHMHHLCRIAACSIPSRHPSELSPADCGSSKRRVLSSFSWTLNAA